MRRLAALAALALAATACGGKRDPGPSDPGGPGTGTWWKPRAGLTWQWQLAGALGTPLPVQVYDVDWEDVDAAQVAALHAAGIRVICYVSVGSWESWRGDQADFPAAVIGNDYAGWANEKYLDIRADAVRTLLGRRFDTCRDKGFDAIEPDNMDVYELGQASGFPLTADDGLAFARWLAAEAHARGLGIGQKNAPGLTASIHGDYDWALTEDCWTIGFCGDMAPYLDADKPVFMCEYAAATFSAACDWAVPRKYSPILKSLGLDAPLTTCP